KKLWCTKVTNITSEHRMNSGPKMLWMYLDAIAIQENSSCPIQGSSAFLPNITISPVIASARKLMAVAQCTRRCQPLKRSMRRPVLLALQDGLLLRVRGHRILVGDGGAQGRHEHDREQRGQQPRAKTTCVFTHSGLPGSRCAGTRPAASCGSGSSTSTPCGRRGTAPAAAGCPACRCTCRAATAG